MAFVVLSLVPAARSQHGFAAVDDTTRVDTLAAAHTDTAHVETPVTVVGDTTRVDTLATALGDTARVDTLVTALGDTTRVDTLATALGDTARVDTLATALGDTARVDTLAAVPAPPPPDLLPFAHNPIPRTYPEVGVSIGLAAYVAGFKGVEDGFHQFEDAYAAAGYPLSPAPDVALPPMVLATFTVSLNRFIDIAGQMGHAGEGNDELRLLGGIVSYCYTPPGSGPVSFHAGLGGGGYGFSFKREYGAVPVTPIDVNGGFYSLDSITLDGGGAYWTTAGGLTARTGPHAAFDALIQYVGASDQSTDTRGGKITVNMSGTMIGVSFTAFF